MKEKGTRKKLGLIVFCCIVRSSKKMITSKICTFFLFSIIKKRSFNLLCVLDLFSERWQSTLFQIFPRKVNNPLEPPHMIRSEADGIVITDILLAPVTMSGLKHNVQSPMSGSLSATVTNSIIKISEVGVQLSE